ncbi:unnamed protein product [Lathyrus oleraceus]
MKIVIFVLLELYLDKVKSPDHLVQTQLDGEVYQHHQLPSNVLYDTVSKVRNSLRVASLGVQGCDKWMKILGMSYHIASKYNVILVSLSRDLNIILFPLVISPYMSTSRHKLITLGLVNNSHWVRVKLKLICPLPSIVNR